MTDDEKAALRKSLLLVRRAAEGDGYLENLSHDEAREHWMHIIAAAERMLAEPRLPEEPTLEILKLMGDSHYGDWRGNIYRALCAHLTKPRTKVVEVWHVEYCRRGDVDANEAWLPVRRTCLNEASANDVAHDLDGAPHFACVRVTGPHKHVVPA